MTQIFVLTQKYFLTQMTLRGSSKLHSGYIEVTFRLHSTWCLAEHTYMQHIMNTFDPTIFLTKKFSGLKKIWTQNIFWLNNFLLTQKILIKKKILTLNFFDLKKLISSKFFWPEIFWPKNLCLKFFSGDIQETFGEYRHDIGVTFQLH